MNHLDTLNIQFIISIISMILFTGAAFISVPRISFNLSLTGALVSVIFGAIVACQTNKLEQQEFRRKFIHSIAQIEPSNRTAVLWYCLQKEKFYLIQIILDNQK